MRWRWLLQQTLGGLQRVPGAAARVVQADGEGAGRCRLGITAECLRELLAGRAPVLVFSRALPAGLCRLAAERLEALACREPGGALAPATRFAAWRLGGNGAPASDYAKLGYTKTDVLREEGLRMAAGRKAPERYLRLAGATSRLLEAEVFAPGRCPMYDICEELGALPGVACRLECCPVTGRPFLPCVVRQMLPGGRRIAGNVHMDTAAPGRTISINVYLRVPEGSSSGGELVLYPVEKGPLSRVLNSHFFATLDVQNFYPKHKFYTEELLSSPSIEPIVYRPAVGDVVLLDPAYPHAVRDFQGPGSPRRISLQTFVQTSWQGPWHRRTQLLEYAV